MKAPLRTRSFVASVLAVSLVALPSNAALAAPPAQPTTTAPTTTPAAGTAPTSTPAPSTQAPADPNAPAPADPNAPADAGTPPTDGDTAGPDAVPVTEVPVEENTEQPPAEPPPDETPTMTAPEGPERPPEPTVGNGRFKARGTGLMIAGGTLLGLGLVGMVTSIFLTRCTELDNSFACRNQQHNTFAVPATGAAALLGAVLLAVGVGYRVRYKRWENWDPNKAKTAFFPSVSPHSVGAGAMIKF